MIYKQKEVVMENEAIKLIKARMEWLKDYIRDGNNNIERFKKNIKTSRDEVNTYIKELKECREALEKLDK